MSKGDIQTPGSRLPALERYPERPLKYLKSIDRWGISLVGQLISRSGWLRKQNLEHIIPAVNLQGEQLSYLDDTALQQHSSSLRLILRGSAKFEFNSIAQSFALIRESATRTLGMRHYPVQLMGGYALIKGMLAEMETGEGKSLTATLAAATAAFAGHPVHIVTVNDYLAQRDAIEMQPLYQFLGLTVAVVTNEMTADQKRQAYSSDIVYCTNKVLAFDYMRDCLTLGQKPGNLHLQTEQFLIGKKNSQNLILRGLSFVIVDEADSVLIDEARTPLIISGEVDSQFDSAMLQQALSIAADLVDKRDFYIVQDEHRVTLTATGVKHTSTLTESLAPPWNIKAFRQEIIRQALAALHIFQREEDYLILDGKVTIIDEYTGRAMPDRQWSQGLHQLIELKEGCELTGQRITLARMTYQRFFRRFKYLSGMTGTAQEVAHELWCVYQLRVTRIPTHRPLQRKQLPPLVVPTLAEKWTVIAQHVAEITKQGRPVLLGTRSVASAKAASDALSQHALSHEILSAEQNQHEADIIAKAGHQGHITIATNMAGRGTDIRLGDNIAELGGLHIIMSERHEAGRIDRQLAGRCARQGDPGSYQAILSLQDPLLNILSLKRLQKLAQSRLPWLAPWLLKYAQHYAEKQHSQMRRSLLRHDDMLGDTLAFTGKQE